MPQLLPSVVCGRAASPLPEKSFMPPLAESFTPDHKPLMGEAPELRGFFLGCGFNSAGE